MHLIPLTSGTTHPVLKSIARDQLWHWGQCKTFQRLPWGHLSEEPAHGEVWQISTLSYKSGAAPEVGWKPSSIWHLLGTWWVGPHLSKEATGFLCSGSSVLHKKEREKYPLCAEPRITRAEGGRKVDSHSVCYFLSAPILVLVFLVILRVLPHPVSLEWWLGTGIKSSTQ